MLTNEQILEKMSVMSNELANMTRELHRKNRELNLANEKLQELDRIKSLFIASMSHELRTPLNSIIGFSYILLHEWDGNLNDEQKTNQAIILRTGKHLLALINDVIDVSKIEAGKLDVHTTCFELQGVIDEALDVFQEELKGKNLSLDVKVCYAKIQCDRRRLLQCLFNLVSNAIKFTDTGSIHISAQTIDGGEKLFFTIRDTGVGIESNDIPKLFKPFSRLHHPGDARYPGTGLGLYLTKKLVSEVLKGEIAVTSTAGEGTSFLIKLPTKVIV